MRFREPSRPWIPVVLWMVAIFAISATPGRSLPPLPGAHTDKLVHATVYAVLGALVCRALARTTTWRGWPGIALAAALATAYGVTDEIHQLFVPGRTSDPADVAADAVGSLTGALAVAFLAARAVRRAGRER